MKAASFHGQAFNEMNFFLTKTNQAGKTSLTAQFARCLALNETPVNVVGSLQHNGVNTFSSQVLSYLPLDWLSDDNHIRCLMGLFSCDVFLNSSVFQVIIEYLFTREFTQLPFYERGLAIMYATKNDGAFN